MHRAKPPHRAPGGGEHGFPPLPGAATASHALGLQTHYRWRGGLEYAPQRQSGGDLEAGGAGIGGGHRQRYAGPGQHAFQFRHVGFAYSGCSWMVIQNINFTLHHDEKATLIGENGAAKTTLVKLLARLCDRTEGQILLDGVDRRESDVEDLRREIGVIFQDYMRYDLLVRENIGFGKVDSPGDRSRVESAAVKSLAKSVIDRLPNGYDQIVGRRFEGGVDLSGGEWQKFALARAYMRDAQLPILDEPTATLDARAEYEVLQRFSELTRARMAVLISHRFSTVRMAERIVVLAEGSIQEQGTRGNLENLIRKKPCSQEWGHGRRGRLRYKREKEDERMI